VYIRVTKQEYVPVLGDRIRECTFHDTAKSWQDSALVGPPTLEFAPFSKMPGGRRRNDNRQGTIDQDQEFKDFLESLTNPITKSAAPEDTQKQEKVKTTPLIEALREKKANKDKPAKGRNARGEAKEDAADKKQSGKQGKETALSAGDKNRRVSKADKAQAAKEAVKILNKEASAAKDSAAATEKGSPAPERKRGNVAGVKSLLQRDLGIGAAPTRRRGTKREVASTPAEAAQPKETPVIAQKPKDVPAAVAGASADKNAQAAKKERPTRAERRAFKASLVDKSNDKTAAAETKVQTPPKNTTAPAPQILKKPQSTQSPAPPKGPATSRPTPTEPTAARNISSSAQVHASPAKSAPASPAPRAAPPAPVPAATSKQAFLKHANPSQGITEPLIEESLKIFGGIEKVEIDKRKGFAYVDFAEPEGLRKAMAASPIKIAQGAVQVLERKEKVARPAVNPRFNGPPPTGPARGGRGGFGPGPRGGRGGRGGARGGGHIGPIANAGTTESPSAAPSAVPVTTPAAAPSAPAPAPVASADAAT
jgi:regulator of nonsense transcripts 3